MRGINRRIEALSKRIPVPPPDTGGFPKGFLDSLSEPELRRFAEVLDLCEEIHGGESLDCARLSIAEWNFLVEIEERASLFRQQTTKGVNHE